MLRLGVGEESIARIWNRSPSSGVYDGQWQFMVNADLLLTQAVLQHLFDLGGIPVPMSLLKVASADKKTPAEAVRNMMNWANNHNSPVGALDYGVPREDVVSIETYARAFKEYAEKPKPVPA